MQQGEADYTLTLITDQRKINRLL